MVYSSIAQSYFDEFPFRRNEHRKPNSGYFFLSHAHVDHTRGIKNSLSDPDVTIVCSKETAAAIKVLHRIPQEKCLIINPNQSLSFDKFFVHALDANHCLGSLMFVIESMKGIKEVFTGDFRLGKPVIDELDLFSNELVLSKVGRNPNEASDPSKVDTDNIERVLHFNKFISEKIENVTLSSEKIADMLIDQEEINLVREMKKIKQYVTNARNHYKKRNDLIKELK